MGFALAATLGCASTKATDRWAEWIALDTPIVFDQLTHSTMSCGPAALATALLAEGGDPARAVLEQGDQAIAASVDAYGTRTGRGGERPRFDPSSGVAPNNLVDWTNDWRADLGADERVGVYLDRRDGESDAQLCARVHGLLVRSLAAGAVPIVRVRAFAPDWYPERGAYLWDGVAAHWIAVLGVPRELGSDGRGFAFDFADPDGGTLERGWIGAETQREFTAARGDTVDWIWLDGRAFLLVTAPGLESLGGARQPWFLRTVVTLDHAIIPPAALDAQWAPEEADGTAEPEANADSEDGANPVGLPADPSTP